MEKREYDQANEELAKAMELDAKDPWVRYYLALGKYRAARASGQSFQGLSNMMQDLRAVLDWYPEFAEAYNMLGMARVEGGGIASAMESVRAAILLSPRNEQYQLDMADIYLADKKWDAAQALLERLRASSNPQVASGAKRRLEDLPTLRKYGILPQRAGESPKGPSAAPKNGPQPSPFDVLDKDAERRAKEQAQAPDTRKVLFLKGKLASVDCSQEPAAVLTVVSGGKTLKLRTDNYKSLLLIGADEFSCMWRNRGVVVNYKAGGKADGDLVSLEVH
jgi:hypothetical protein